MNPASHPGAPAVLPLCAALVALVLMACDQRMPGGGTRPSVATAAGPAGLSVIASASAAAAGESYPEHAVKPMPLADKVKAALMSDARLRNSAIGVKEAQGVVTLNGTVDTSLNRDRAARIAYSVNGTQYVKSNLLITSAW
jgi:osmotically-inducible protein OsmY